MKYALAVALLLVTTMFVTATPQDAAKDSVSDAIEAKTKAFYQAWNDGDIAAAFDMIMVGGTGFLADGGERMTIESREMRDGIVAEYQAAVDSGMKMENTIRDLAVNAGDGGAVASLMIDAKMTPPGGEVMEMTERVTLVWVPNEEGEWRIMHWHMSFTEDGRPDMDAMDEGSR